MTSLLQASLLQDAVLRAGSEIIARLARNSDPTRFVWVRELTVTSTGYCETPAILLQQPGDFAYLHTLRITGSELALGRLCLGNHRYPWNLVLL
jgi:hypothetical protein